jgi:HD superfamily phosphohydrolase
MSKYLLKFIKYILPSSKDWTGVGLLSYRDVYLHSTSISRENIVLSIELVLKSQTQLQQRLTIKEPPVMRIFWAFAKKPDLDC